MKRIIDQHLQDWKLHANRKALLVRGARQVGKTYAIRKLGDSFDEFVEINLEMRPDIAKVFEYNLDPERILRELRLLTGKQLVAEKTLLFFDEIQEFPRAVNALRYFQEMHPDLHVVSAGSLMEFTLEEIGLPVGRVSSLHMYPMSFLEFLAARDKSALVEFLLSTEQLQDIGEAVHEQLLRLLGEYLLVGGLPEVVKQWSESQDPVECGNLLDVIVSGYRQDFQKYAKKHQVKYVDLLFSEIPMLIGRRFKYTSISGSWKARELSPALELLRKAAVVHKVNHSSGNALPLKAESKPEQFKLLFLDIGLAQRVMSADILPWLIDPNSASSKVGAITESFVGQELLAYSNPKTAHDLFYWHREARSSNAEVDYLIADNESILPVEVKAGSTGSLRSLHRFIEEKPQTPFSLRFWGSRPTISNQLHSFPLYAVGHVLRRSIPDGWLRGVI